MVHFESLVTFCFIIVATVVKSDYVIRNIIISIAILSVGSRSYYVQSGETVGYAQHVV